MRKAKKWIAIGILGLTWLTRHGLWRLVVEWAERNR